MTRHHLRCQSASLSRRHLLRGLAGVGCVAVAGCDDGLPINLISRDDVRELGLETWQRVRGQRALSDNAEYLEAAQRLSGDLLRAAGEEPGAWEVAVFSGGEVNAFAIPGNKIGIFEGMFRVADDAPQLAAVIGHEIGHHKADHAFERMNASALTSIALRLVSFVLQVGDVQYAQQIAGLLGLGAEYGVLRPYSRGQELEADAYGLRAMAQAGYDPNGAIELWQAMNEVSAGVPGFLSTHPAPLDRVEALRAMLPEVLDIYRASG